MMKHSTTNKIAVLTTIPLNMFLVYLYWTYAPIVLAQQEEETKITLFEDYSGEIVNGSKHVGFVFNLTEPGINELLWEDNKILFPNGTTLIE
jgi:hypothetical protein